MTPLPTEGHTSHGRFGGCHPDHDPERRKWQSPEAVLAEIGLRPGDTFIDIGCGAGFFAIPAARMVGENGKVYGLDISSEALDLLRGRAAEEGLANISLTLGRAEDTIVCEGCGDTVFFGNVLHDFDDPRLVLQNARHMVKSSGRLVNLDWKKEPMTPGPPIRKRLNEEDAAQMIAGAGFRVELRKESGPYHYLLVARPQPAR